jgi:hypothetical protein
MRHTKSDLIDLSKSFFSESKATNRANWMITLHPGYKYAKSKEWRSASKERALIATRGFLLVINSFLTNSRSESNYVKGIVAIENSEHHHWHSHIIIRQTVADQESFQRKLNKVEIIVNNENYCVKVADTIYPKSMGIGYSNERGRYMHYTKLDDDVDKQSQYLVKHRRTLINLLDSRNLGNNFYSIEHIA